MNTPKIINQKDNKLWPWLYKSIPARIEIFFAPGCHQKVLKQSYAKTFEKLWTGIAAKVAPVIALQYTDHLNEKPFNLINMHLLPNLIAKNTFMLFKQALTND